MSIFISIASYCDPLLSLTMQQAYEKAAWPDSLHFGVVDQSPLTAPYPVPASVPAKQVTYIKIEASQTHGCCWARSLAMSLMGRQDWFLQIDSHMIFEQNWDATLIGKINTLMRFTPRCILSSYPPSFKFVNGVPTPQSSSQRLIAHVVSPQGMFEPGNPVLPFQSKQLFGLGAVEGFHLAAGCLFASAEYVHQFPYDPYLYFNEEEASMAVRLFTNDWTTYHVMGIPIFHLYNENDGTINRPLPWDAKTQEPKQAEDQDQPLWSRLISRARERMNILMSQDSSSLGVYGLGHKRSLQDYAEECGIDYINRVIHPKAYFGPWESGASPASTEDTQAPADQAQANT